MFTIMSEEQFPGVDEHVVERPFSSPKRLAVTFVALLAVAAGVYSAWWFWLASQVRTDVDAWVSQMRLDGRTAGYERLTVQGFPGPVDIEISGIEAADPDGGWHIAVPALRGALIPWNIDRADGAFAGPLTLNLTKGASAGRYVLSAERNAVRVNRDDGGTAWVDLGGLEVSRGDVDGTLRIESMDLRLIRGTLPVYGRLAVDARNVNLPREMHSAFGGEVAHLLFTADATGAELPEGISVSALRRWSEDGGAVDVNGLDVVHGVLGLKGDGTMALDGELQPIGAFAAQITGFNAAVDALVRAGAAREQDGALAKVVLGVLAKVPPGGGPKAVSLPLSLQNRRLSVGPIPLIRLRRIEWE